jgi:hypothetical protein
MTQVRYGALLLLVALSPFTRAATLKPETAAAWDAYLQQATAAMQARLQPGANFLWLEEEPGRTEFVRTKGPLIGPVNKHIPQKVSHGLIHDWLGAGFVPNARIEDILRIVRDYNSYKRLSSITRLEERDGGVYTELEALALSRDIPTAFRAFVTPIVRRVSRDSLATSLRQTKVAIDDQLPHHGQVQPGNSPSPRKISEATRYCCRSDRGCCIGRF